MQSISDWYFSIVFFSSVLGITVAAILYFANRNESFTSRLLAGFFLFFSILALNYSLMTTRFYLNFPHGWRILGWASFSFAPFAYLYVRSVLEQAYRFKKWDFLLFLPAILYTLSMIPFYFLPLSEKRAFLEQVVANPRLILREPEGIFPAGWGAWSRVVLGVCTTTAQFFMLKKWEYRILGSNNPVSQNVATYRWLFLFTLIQAVFYLVAIIAFVLNFTGHANNHLVIFTISATILFYAVYLFLRPAILYGMKNWLQEPDGAHGKAPGLPSAIVDELQPVSNKRSTLTLDQRREFKKALESHFESEKPFRKNGYTISDLSQELELPSHQLSAFINQEYGLNFNELINKHRILFLTEMLKNSPDHFQYTLEALGKMAGFNSRTAFFSSVKKNTGKSPSEYFGRKEDGAEQ